jgi:hypothetical protein
VLLQRGEVDVIVLEAGAVISGGWFNQYSSLKITTRRAHCGLPHYPVPQSYAADIAQRAGHSTAAHSTDGKLSYKLKRLSHELIALLMSVKRVCTHLWHLTLLQCAAMSLSAAVIRA